MNLSISISFLDKDNNIVITETSLHPDVHSLMSISKEVASIERKHRSEGIVWNKIVIEKVFV